MTKSTALLTDMYELTMIESTLKSGKADTPSVFEVFARRLPGGRRYGVVAGTARVLDAIENFRFGEEEIAYLREAKVVGEETLEWLANYKFSGNIRGYAEGELYFPGSPILTVEGSFADALDSVRDALADDLDSPRAIEAIDVWAEGVLVGGQRGSGDDLARQAIEARLGVVL